MKIQFTKINYGKPKMGWRYDKNTMDRLIEEERILWPINDDGRPRRKVFLNELGENNPGFSSMIGESFFTRHGTLELEHIFEYKAFAFPKPSELINSLIKQGSLDSDIILDFFSGSATTAHAVMKLNSEDGRNRKFIMVQLPEITDEKSEAYKAGYKNICEIGKERIRRAGDAIRHSRENGNPSLLDPRVKHEDDAYNLDIGFKVLKLDSSNIKEWCVDCGDDLECVLKCQTNNIKEERSNEDLLYEILLKYGLDLTLPIDELLINGKKIFNIGFGALVCYLDDAINLDTFQKIAELKKKFASRYGTETMRVVFRDGSFDDSVVKTNAFQILKQSGINEVVSI